MMRRTNKHFQHFEIRIWVFWLIFPYGNQNKMRYLLTVRFSVLWMRCMTKLSAQFSFKIQNKTHIYANTHDTFTRNAKRQGKRNKVALKTQTHTFVHTLSAQWVFPRNSRLCGLWQWTWPWVSFNTWHEDYTRLGLHSILSTGSVSKAPIINLSQAILTKEVLLTRYWWTKYECQKVGKHQIQLPQCLAHLLTLSVLSLPGH